MANWVFPGWYGANYCLHTHAFFHSFDQFHAGVPSRVEFADRDVRLDDEKQAQGGRWYGFDNQ